MHAGDVGLGAATDQALLDYAIRDDRIVVTRNYAHFAPLARSYARRGRSFPGILFLSRSLPLSDAGRHVRALEDWVKAAPRGGNPIANTCGWLG